MLELFLALSNEDWELWYDIAVLSSDPLDGEAYMLAWRMVYNHALGQQPQQPQPNQQTYRTPRARKRCQWYNRLRWEQQQRQLEQQRLHWIHQPFQQLELRQQAYTQQLLDDQARRTAEATAATQADFDRRQAELVQIGASLHRI